MRDGRSRVRATRARVTSAGADFFSMPHTRVFPPYENAVNHDENVVDRYSARHTGIINSRLLSQNGDIYAAEFRALKRVKIKTNIRAKRFAIRS